MDNRPLLVTGIHRSGTTWVGRMLAAGGNTTYVNEPLSVTHRPGILRLNIKHWYEYISGENEAGYLPAFKNLINQRYFLLDEVRSIHERKDVLRMGRDLASFLLGRIRGSRVLLKDPFAAFSTPWFADRLNCRVVITIRHPAGFASSLMRLNWPFQIEDLLAQPLLMRDHLEPYRTEMESVAPDDEIGRSCLLWNALYGTLHKTLQQRTDLIAVRHEDLSRDPANGFRNLYNKLNMDFTPKVEEVILNSSSSENPAELTKQKRHSVKLDSRSNLDNWKKRLGADDIARIRKMTKDVSHLFYTEDEW